LVQHLVLQYQVHTSNPSIKSLLVIGPGKAVNDAPDSVYGAILIIAFEPAELVVDPVSTPPVSAVSGFDAD